MQARGEWKRAGAGGESTPEAAGAVQRNKEPQSLQTPPSNQRAVVPDFSRRVASTIGGAALGPRYPRYLPWTAASGPTCFLLNLKHLFIAAMEDDRGSTLPRSSSPLRRWSHRDAGRATRTRVAAIGTPSAPAQEQGAGDAREGETSCGGTCVASESSSARPLFYGAMCLVTAASYALIRCARSVTRLTETSQGTATRFSPLHRCPRARRAARPTICLYA